MSIEPINWISSQKIWMESTVSFFTIFSLYLFIKALRQNRRCLFLLSGVFIGLAVLTKYPGILSLFIICIYALLKEKRVFREKSFLFVLVIPFVMLSPWVYWNYRIYKFNFISEIFTTHGLTAGHFNIFGSNYILPGFLIVSLIVLFIYLSKNRGYFANAFMIFILIAFIFLLYRNILNGMRLFYIPQTGWMIGMFSDEPWFFYLGRFIELSPIYIFSFAGILLYCLDREYKKEYIFLMVTIAVILIFYIWWKNYQSRYVLASVIPLIILSSRTQFFISTKIDRFTRPPLRQVAKIAFVLLIAFMIIKTLIVDVALTVVDNVCYF